MTTARTIVLAVIIVLALAVAGGIVFFAFGLAGGVVVHSGGTNHVPIVSGQPAST
jgi:hypothetical protein